MKKLFIGIISLLLAVTLTACGGKTERDDKTLLVAATSKPHGDIEPFGFYSKQIKNINELKKNDIVVISNSVADHGRILAILDEAGIIELDDKVKVQDATIEDIKTNRLNLEFKEIKPELLTNAYKNDEGALIAINGNYAIDAGLNPTKDAILLESADESNPYVNIVACQKGHENDKKIKALVAVLQSQKIKDFITNTYSDGSVIPVK